MSKVRLSSTITIGLLFTLLESFTAIGQTRIDSLKIQIERHADIRRFYPLLDLAREYAKVDLDNEAVLVVKEARLLALTHGDTIAIIKSTRMLCQLLNRVSAPDDAEKLLLEILPVVKRHYDKIEYEMILNNLAIVYTDQARYDKALKFSYECLHLREGDVDKGGVASVLTNIAVIYYKLKNYDKAIAFNQRAVLLKNETHNSNFLDRLFVNLSLCYAFKNDFSNATRYLNDALRLCNGSCSQQLLLESYYARGVIDFRSGNLNGAETSFLSSYAISMKIGNQRFALENVVYLADVYIKKNAFSQASAYLKTAEELCSSLNFNLLRLEIYKQFSALYNQSSDYKKATHYQSKYIDLRDSVYGAELTQKLMVVQAENEQLENKSKIESQNKILTLKEDVIKQQRMVNMLALAAMMLVIILIVIFVANNRDKKNEKVHLEAKVKERTLELQYMYDTLQRSYNEQKQSILKTSKEMKVQIKTINGLCSLIKLEATDDNSVEFVKGMEYGVNSLSETIDTLSAKENLVKYNS